ncbi:MAG TPA: hypothetical protein VF665_12265 [Longimicrobium sp.]|jgi:hypothetical protein|uniref:hypothetical protein n=1 Tax=Longimicrobium sp. TaxID=2029185 RepID=UPI002EDB5C63
MIRRTVLAALLVLSAAACGRAPTDAAVRAEGRPALDSLVDNPPPPDTTGDNGGGTLGSGT